MGWGRTREGELGQCAPLHSSSSIPHFPFSILHPHGSAGQSLVEFALTLPVLLLILMAVFDMGRAVYAQNVLTHAVREGARYGAIRVAETPCHCQDIRSQTENAVFGLALQSVTVAVGSQCAGDAGCDSLEAGQESNTIRVAVTHDFTAVTPLVDRYLGQSGTITLEAASTMSVEGLP
ncbi:MAG: hypothetical protein MAG451_02277 [Anaerolineales bacterium]|nr:hypothetical protein [Anaerolineales bacterium]